MTCQSGVYSIPGSGFTDLVSIDDKISSFKSYDPVGLFSRIQRWELRLIRIP